MDADERFEALYASHAEAVLRFARRRVSAADAEDVLADVFVAAWRRRVETPEDPLPWLLGIAAGVVANHRRGGQRRDALHQRLSHQRRPPAPAVGPADERVWAALERVPARDREILLLITWDGLDREQIAAMLGIAHSTVAVRLLRARRRFERAYAQVSDQPTDATTPHTTSTEVRS